MAEGKGGLAAVALCGGAGARLWPLSRAQLAKPFVTLPSGGTLLGELLDSLPGLGADAAVLVTSAAQAAHCRAAAAARSKQSPPATVVVEPAGRGTAPAIATAAKLLRARHGDEVCLLLLPADHHIADRAAFGKALRQAEKVARAERRLVLLGIEPDRPATGYGYLQLGEARDGWREIAGFKEKPDRAEAERLLAAGGYLWNAGVYVATAAVIEEQIAAHAPQVAAVAAGLGTPPAQGDWEPAAEAYGAYPSISIEYAVSERSDRLAAVPAACGWSDLGTWDDWLATLPADEKGNRVAGEVALADAENVGALSVGGRLVAVAGVRDVVVVDAPDAVLVTGRGAANAVRDVHAGLAEQKHPAVDSPAREERPWGRYRLLGRGPGWQAKSIEVEPGRRLSLQSHAHRSERWTVVRGRIEATVGEEVTELGPGDSCFIPQGAKHRMANPGAELAELVEVQFGEVLAEDDIVRYEDDFARS
ncbi:MAG: mannose-1-phosphate guanylyltransferase/mannose-6-phosphate isomerase [Betaproteobacteria bacterium AqS2]|uniref:mannose-1-phosphate guanylyltransferase n=1 Tax=Candidatus Amphirhobacter heronislandensis TaxID=1732024 RepID=A0A930UDF5_9GAMM|nr:mannose-1-phosphate guanylyltransferase/mannose-6-phosphate isomerase [Betaproteobacteria bacterium AqS2]